MSILRIEGIYPEQRPQKVLARQVVYSTFLRVLGHGPFHQGKHLVLLGGGGDVDLLHDLGVRDIVAVDSNPDVIQAVAPRYAKTGCVIYDQDIREVLSILPRVSTVNLDLCGTLNRQNIELVQTVISHLRPGAAFAVTLFASRERTADALEQVARARPIVARQIRGQEAAINPLSRAVAAFRMLRAPGIHALRFVSYQSHGSSVLGRQVCSPMAIFLGVIKTNKTFPFSRFVPIDLLSRKETEEEIRPLIVHQHLNQRSQ